MWIILSIRRRPGHGKVRRPLKRSKTAVGGVVAADANPVVVRDVDKIEAKDAVEIDVKSKPLSQLL
jgi:hypothetical protein